MANLPRLVNGSLDASGSTGACTGEVGNKHSLQIVEAAPAPCGFPQHGEVRADATYTLSAHCQLTGGHLFIKEGVTVTVNGNGRSIRGDGTSVILIGGDSRLNINNVALEVLRVFNDGHLEGELLAFYGQTVLAFLNRGTANINKLLLKDLDFTENKSHAILNYFGLGSGTMTIRDGIFDNIKNDDNRCTIRSLGDSTTLTLEGCVSFINNSPKNISIEQDGVFTDNTGGATCPDALRAEFPAKYKPPRKRDSDGSASAAPRVSSSLSLPVAQQGRFGLITSEEWRSHFARLGIQARDATKQARWSTGDASLTGMNACFWDYECSTDAHWA